MSKDLAIAVIHGVGWQQAGYSNAMMAEINGRLSREHGLDSQRIAWSEIHWAPITEALQRTYLSEARETLHWLPVRELLVSFLGDAAAYQRVHGVETSTYTQIHALVRQSIDELHGKLGQSDRPLVVLAHSMGGHIISNYIWDLQRGHVSAQGLSGFQRMQTLVGMVTFGCNIPLFAMAHQTPTPIEFPPSQLPPDWAAKARWLNFFDRDDVLAYPIKALGGSYEALPELEDVQINVGRPWTSWNPWSHTGYWTHRNFTKPVAGYLAELLATVS